MTANDIVAKALAIYEDRDNWTYCQGGLGQLGESMRIQGLYTYYRAKGNSSTMDYPEWLAKIGRGKHCTDCSNFINVLLGLTTNKYSVWSLSKLPVAASTPSDATPGTVLIMSGHVGIVTGPNECVDIYAYNETLRKSPIDVGLWEYAVYLPEVIYSDVLDITVRVTDRQRKVGDKITYDDFVVDALLADGGTKELKDYNYTPGTITYTKCQVAIVYGDIIKYVYLSAELTGEYYAVMIPTRSAESALALQEELQRKGYEDTAIVQL